MHRGVDELAAGHVDEDVRAPGRDCQRDRQLPGTDARSCSPRSVTIDVSAEMISTWVLPCDVTFPPEMCKRVAACIARIG